MTKFTKAIETDPRDARNFVGRAFAWSKKAEDVASAAAYYERAAHTDPHAGAPTVYGVPTASSSAAAQWNAGWGTTSAATSAQHHPAYGEGTAANAGTFGTSENVLSGFSSLNQPSRSRADIPSAGGSTCATSRLAPPLPVPPRRSMKRRLAAEGRSMRRRLAGGRRRTKKRLTGRSPTTARPSGSIRNSPMLTNTAHTSIRLRSDSTWPWPTLAKPFGSTARTSSRENKLCAMYVLVGDLDKAIADLTEIIRLDPNTVEYYTRTGQLYAKKGDGDKAAADYIEAYNRGSAAVH